MSCSAHRKENRRQIAPRCRLYSSLLPISHGGGATFFSSLNLLVVCYILLSSLCFDSVLAINKNLKNINTIIPATKCKFPFDFKGAVYYGCTTADDTKPWCAIEAPRELQDWRFCDASTITQIPAFSQDNCTPKEGWKRDNETVYGCAKFKGETRFQCTADKDAKACAKLDVIVMAAGVVGAGGGGGANSPNSGGGSSSSTGIILAVVGSLLVVAIIAGLFITKRRHMNGDGSGGHSQWDFKNPSNVMAPGASYGFAGDPGLFTPGGSITANAAAQKVYTVISTYTPTLGDELEIQPGDKVSVLVEYDDGWCQGMNHTRGGSKGVFPRHCVDME